MVVSRLAAQDQSDPCVGAWCFEQVGSQFLFDERVRIADVDEQFGHARAILDERDRVMPAPRRTVVAEIAGQRLLTPWHLAWGDDRRKGGDAAEAARVAQRNS